MPSLSIWSVQHFKNTLDLSLEPFHPSKDLQPQAEELETTCTILNLEKIQLEFFYFSIFPAILVSFSVSCWYILLRSRKPSWTDGWLDLVIIPMQDIHCQKNGTPDSKATLLSKVTIEANSCRHVNCTCAGNEMDSRNKGLKYLFIIQGYKLQMKQYILS